MGKSEYTVTQWLEEARSGNENARELLWLRYYERLVRVAKGKLQPGRGRVADEEDFASLAMASFMRAFESGRLSDVTNRNSLFRVLLEITDNKIRDHYRSENRLKRGAGQVRGHSVFLVEGADQYDEIPDPSAGFAEGFSLCCQERLAALGEELRQIAVLKFEGFTNKEIGERIGRDEETVRRKVSSIRTAWSNQE